MPVLYSKGSILQAIRHIPTFQMQFSSAAYTWACTTSLSLALRLRLACRAARRPGPARPIVGVLRRSYSLVIRDSPGLGNNLSPTRTHNTGTHAESQVKTAAGSDTYLVVSLSWSDSYPHDEEDSYPPDEEAYPGLCRLRHPARYPAAPVWCGHYWH
jgi:hypothetical protein